MEINVETSMNLSLASDEIDLFMGIFEKMYNIHNHKKVGFKTKPKLDLSEDEIEFVNALYTPFLEEDDNSDKSE